MPKTYRFFRVSATHSVNNAKYGIDDQVVTVCRDGFDGRYYWQWPNLGCSKSYSQPEYAISGMLNEHASHVTKCVELTDSEVLEWAISRKIGDKETMGKQLLRGWWNELFDNAVESGDAHRLAVVFEQHLGIGDALELINFNPTQQEKQLVLDDLDDIMDQSKSDPVDLIKK